MALKLVRRLDSTVSKEGPEVYRMVSSADIDDKTETISKVSGDLNPINAQGILVVFPVVSPSCSVLRG